MLVLLDWFAQNLTFIMSKCCFAKVWLLFTCEPSPKGLLDKTVGITNMGILWQQKRYRENRSEYEKHMSYKWNALLWNENVRTGLTCPWKYSWFINATHPQWAVLSAGQGYFVRSPSHCDLTVKPEGCPEKHTEETICSCDSVWWQNVGNVEKLVWTGRPWCLPRVTGSMLGKI